MRHDKHLAAEGTFRNKVEIGATLQERWLASMAAHKMEVLQAAFDGASDVETYMANRSLRLEMMVRQTPDTQFVAWVEGGAKPEKYDLLEYVEQGFVTPDQAFPHEDAYAILGVDMPHNHPALIRAQLEAEDTVSHNDNFALETREHHAA